MINFFKKIFGLSSSKVDVLDQDVAVLGNEKDLETFVSYIVSGLVDNTKAVKIKTDYLEKEIKIVIACAVKDIGKVVGKKGQTIRAIHYLLNGAASRFDKKINVEVLN